MDRVEIKVCRLPFRIHIIGWVLNRCEIIDIHIIGDYNDPPWMLSGGALHSGSPFGQSVHFCCTIMKIVIPLKPFYKTECGFVCYRTDRSCTVNIIFSEKNLCIIVRFGLVFPREVQIDIGDFISMET